VTLAVTGKTICGRVVWRRVMQVFELLRWLLTGSLRDLRWLSGRGKTLTLCVFPLISVADKVKGCDAGGYGENYLRSGCSASQYAGVSGASIAVDRKSIGHTVAERSWKDADIVCNSWN
jgi:hypothetical protein